MALPGLGLGHGSWRPTLDLLPAEVGASVQLFPGYGRPAPRGFEVSPAALGALVSEHLPEVARPVVLLAHSASCQVAAHVAALAPERIAALVLVGPTTDPRAATWPGLVRRWLPTALHEELTQLPGLVRQWSRTGLPTMKRAMNAARHDDLLRTLDEVRAPVLVVRGRHDSICPADWSEAVARHGGVGSRSVTLSRGAHMVPNTHGPAVAVLVREAITAVR